MANIFSRNGGRRRKYVSECDGKLIDSLSRYEHGSLDHRHWYAGITCSICGTLIEPWQHFNWDHDVPLAAGGKRGRANKRFAHCICNSVKGDQYPFSMRTAEEREAVRAWVRPVTWDRLQRTWNGESA